VVSSVFSKIVSIVTDNNASTMVVAFGLSVFQPQGQALQHLLDGDLDDEHMAEDGDSLSQMTALWMSASTRASFCTFT